MMRLRPLCSSSYPSLVSLCSLICGGSLAMPTVRVALSTYLAGCALAHSFLCALRAPDVGNEAEVECQAIYWRRALACLGVYFQPSSCILGRHVVHVLPARFQPSSCILGRHVVHVLPALPAHLLPARSSSPSFQPAGVMSCMSLQPVRAFSGVMSCMSLQPVRAFSGVMSCMSFHYKQAPGDSPWRSLEAELVDPSVTRWYHCMSRCVRRAFLLGEGDQNRKEWLENRLEELAEIFAVAVGGFSVMDNHLHCCCGSIQTSRRGGRMKKWPSVGDGSFHLATSLASRCR